MTVDFSRDTTFIVFFCFADSSTEATPRPVSAPVISSNDTNDRVKDNANEVTLSLRRPRSSAEDKGKDIFKRNLRVS